MNPPHKSMTIQAAYQKWSATYDRDPNRTRDLDAEVVRQLLGEQKLGTVLEMGCGTGKNTAFLARHSELVAAVDFSPAMMQQALSKIAAGRVVFLQADIAAPWPFRSRCADLVTFSLVLEHLEALEVAFGEAFRVLKPQGRLLVSELHPFRQYLGVQARFGDGEKQVKIPAFVHHLSDYLHAGRACGFQLEDLQEWWHPTDTQGPPRLLTLQWRR
ncbi:MAG: class I SAM-dependent methyltransferase, partial [Calditrichaeota bacterium]